MLRAAAPGSVPARADLRWHGARRGWFHPADEGEGARALARYFFAAFLTAFLGAAFFGAAFCVAAF